MKKILFIIFIIALLFISCYKAEADQFTNAFYDSVNILRESRDLVPLKSSRNIENVAISYSAVMAENGYIDHNALTQFEFSALCENYEIPISTLLEVLASYPNDYVPYQVLLLFLMSDSHKEALLDPRGRFIGAGYIKKGSKTFFTAYIMIGDK
ncbi:MAG: hypothetical protein KAR20_13525 [Candidatus Heimdallarchaeota archaeon]|nr:hypothetical protein [Candidatus Heimdallarchaeota archaeon]